MQTHDVIRVSFLTKGFITIPILFSRKHSNKKVTTGGQQHYPNLSSFRVRRVVQSIKVMQLSKAISNSENKCVEIQATVS